MYVKLAELKPNPMRDFIVDPIDRTTVDALKASIHEHGFWGGIACRQLGDGSIEIACGHHRVLAALEEGIVAADVFVRQDVTNSEMVRLYAKENATQRANTSSTALAGSIASAVHLLAKAAITGVSEKFFRNPHAEDIAQGNMESGRGVGRDVILEFFADVPGMNGGIVEQQLANLKASGDYARILAEVEQEIAAEHAAELQVLAAQEAAAIQASQEAEAQQAREASAKAHAAHAPVKARAKKATAKAAETPVTFDFEGASKHLKNAHQLAVFRTIVTGPALRDVLAVCDQAALARQLVGLAADRGKELSAAFIRENITNMLLASKEQARTRTKEEEARLARADVVAQARQLQENFLRSAYSMASSGQKLVVFLRHTWPKHEPFPVKAVFLTILKDVQKVIDVLVQRMEHETPTDTHKPRTARRQLIEALDGAVRSHETEDSHATS